MRSCQLQVSPEFSPTGHKSMETYLGNEPNQGQDDAWDDIEQTKRYSVSIGTSICAGCTTDDVDDESTAL